jgi:hypothetical protein
VPTASVSAAAAPGPSTDGADTRLCRRRAADADKSWTFLVLCFGLQNSAKNNELMNVSFTFVDTVEGCRLAIPSLKGASQIAVDLEGILDANGNLSLISVEGGGKIYVFDILVCPDILGAGLADILRDMSIVKIFHDCRADSEALFGQQNLTLHNVFDTQIAHSIIEGRDTRNSRVGLNVVLEKYCNYRNPHKDAVQHRPGLWEQRPLPPHLLEYAAYDVKYLREAYFKMRFCLNERGRLLSALTASNENVQVGINAALRKAPNRAGRTPRPSAQPPPQAVPRPAATFLPPPAADDLLIAWKDAIAEHLASSGGEEIRFSTLGVLFPRPPGLATRQTFHLLLSRDPRFAVATNAVSLNQAPPPALAAVPHAPPVLPPVPPAPAPPARARPTRRDREVALTATATAFWEHARASAGVRAQCATRAGFDAAYAAWRAARPATAGGPGTVLFRSALPSRSLSSPSLSLTSRAPFQTSPWPSESLPLFPRPPRLLPDLSLGKALHPRHLFFFSSFHSGIHQSVSLPSWPIFWSPANPLPSSFFPLLSLYFPTAPTQSTRPTSAPPRRRMVRLRLARLSGGGRTIALTDGAAGNAAATRARARLEAAAAVAAAVAAGGGGDAGRGAVTVSDVDLERHSVLDSVLYGHRVLKTNTRVESERVYCKLMECIETKSSSHR